MKNLYTEKTKMLAVEKVLRFGEKECKVAKELGINEESLKKWIDSEKKSSQLSKNLYISKLLEEKIKDLSVEKHALISVLKILVKELSSEKH